MNNKDTKSKEEPKIMSVNNFSTVYSLTNGGSQNQGPFISDTRVFNIYNVPYGINAELLARNKSKNGNFTDNLQVDGNDIIEFKLSITNISTTNTLYNVSSRIDISDKLLNNSNIPVITTMGTANVNPLQSSFNISKLPPETTAIATYAFAAIYNGTLSFSGYTNVKAESYSEIRTFNFNKLPSISIINAPNLSSITPIINMSKSQKLILPDISNSFIFGPINVVNGDIIEFELYIRNSDPNKTNAYNVKIVDKLGNNLSYIEGSFRGSYVGSSSSNNIWGDANFNSTNATTVNGKLVGGSIEWTMSKLDSEVLYPSSNAYAASLYFQCEVVV